MARKFSCVLTGAWIVLGLLIVLLVALWLASTLFGLHVWEEFREWIGTLNSPPAHDSD